MKLSKHTISATRRLPGALNRAYSEGGKRSTTIRPFTTSVSEIGMSNSTSGMLSIARGGGVQISGLNRNLPYRGFASEARSKSANVGVCIVSLLSAATQV